MTTPHIFRRWKEYTSLAHTRSYLDESNSVLTKIQKEELEGVGTFGLSAEMWLKLWHFSVLTFPYLFGVRHIKMFVWRLKHNL